MHVTMLIVKGVPPWAVAKQHCLRVFPGGILVCKNVVSDDSEGRGADRCRGQVMPLSPCCQGRSLLHWPYLSTAGLTLPKLAIC